MLSKTEIKLITSLGRKKYRNEHQLFLVEGIKGISEFLNSDFELYKLYTTKDFFNSEKSRTSLISEQELKKISQLSTPQTALAVFHFQKNAPVNYKKLSVALDGIRDPGNLGTIIRLCDWFGVKQLLCSPDTVDCYNPKVVQASMGSFTRVAVHFLDLKKYIAEAPQDFNCFGSFMNGKNVYTESLPEEGLLVMGNEANGISSEIEKLLNRRVSIPQFGTATESLNVATATAILLSEFNRNQFTEK